MRDYPSLDGDASETQRVYTGSGLECPTSSEIGGLYSLAPKSACSRGVQVGCERGLSPRSRLRGGQSAGCCSVNERGGRVCVSSGEPWLSFYSLKGR